MSTPAISTPAPTRAALPDVRLWIEVFVWRHGLVWIVDTLCLALALALLLALPRSLDRELAQQQAINAQLDARTAQLSKQRQQASDASAPPTVLEVLPERNLADANVRAIYELAEDLGLSISKTSFRTVASRRTGIVRLQMTMPIRNQYPAIADFVEELLRRMPAVSVDQLRFRRDSVMRSGGEAELQLSLWTRDARAIGPAHTSQPRKHGS